MPYPKDKEIRELMKVIDEWDTHYWRICQLKEWKKEFYAYKWKKHSKKDKIIYLATLAEMLNQGSEYDIVKQVKLFGTKYKCSMRQHTITLDKKNPSVLSLLHEFCHLLYQEFNDRDDLLDGYSRDCYRNAKVEHPDTELVATALSAYLYKQAFPKEYSKLHWLGHMLIPDETSSVN